MVHAVHAGQGSESSITPSHNIVPQTGSSTVNGKMCHGVNSMPETFQGEDEKAESIHAL